MGETTTETKTRKVTSEMGKEDVPARTNTDTNLVAEKYPTKSLVSEESIWSESDRRLIEGVFKISRAHFVTNTEQDETALLALIELKERIIKL